MAENKYENVREWLDSAAKMRGEGHQLISSDDPMRRIFTFVDDNSDVHLIGMKHAKETLTELTKEEKVALLEPETRKALVEKGVS